MYYQIEGTNVRIAGSMHQIPKGTTIPLWILEAYRWSEELYLEADSADLKNHVFMPDGELTEQRIPPQLWPSLKAAWPAGGHLDSQKLWTVAAVLATAGLDLAPGVEPQLGERMRIDSRLARYLETMADFAALAESIPDAVYVQAITKLLSNHAERARGIADMYTAWMSGRVENVESVKQRVMLGQFPQVREMMFDRRNFAWLPKIIDILASKRRTLIVVGAGHLGGANGLLKLLDGAGHQYSDVV